MDKEQNTKEQPNHIYKSEQDMMNLYMEHFNFEDKSDDVDLTMIFNWLERTSNKEDGLNDIKFVKEVNKILYQIVRERDIYYYNTNLNPSESDKNILDKYKKYYGIIAEIVQIHKDDLLYNSKS